MSFRAVCLFLISLATTAGCGGSGVDGVGTIDDQSGAPASAASVLTGVFIDNAVGGVEYSTLTLSGVTDSNGRFTYESGQTVTFSLGDIRLGEAPGQDQVTLFDIVPGAVAVSGARMITQSLSRDTAYQRAINIATLLQTLDVDGDLVNGISISESVRLLFTGVNVDFSKTPADFLRDTVFRTALNAANAQALFSGYRAVRKPWQVLAHVYDGLGIEAPRQKLREVSYADAGEPATRITTYQYDQAGRLTRVATDVDADGSVDRFYRDSYDPNGNLVRRENDANADGVADSSEALSYDADQNRTGTATDSNGDGNVDSAIRYAYDSSGNLLRRESDADGNGTTDSIGLFRYDDAGHLISHQTDRNADGTAERSVSFTFDPTGDQVRREQDDDADGQPDRIETLFYDANNRLVRTESDSDIDGITDWVETRTYDASGNLIQSVSDGVFNNALDHSLAWIFDESGNLIRYQEDSNNDGVPDRIATYQYDDQGNQIRYEDDSDADGTPDRLTVTVYGETRGWRQLFELDQSD